MATFLRALVTVAILIAAGRVVAQQQLEPSDETVTYWIEKIELEQERAAEARGDVARLEQEISRAKRRRYPRGEALREKIDALEAAREAGAKAEALIPELLDNARRAGVSPGALREFE